MQRFFIDLAFKGTNYHGWQIQPNAHTVQAEIEKAMMKVLKEEIKTTGAGRTDTGVHARKYTAHFEIENDLSLTTGDLRYKLNAVLPVDIAIRSVYPVSPTAHARYSAISRTYQYTLNTAKNPFYTEYSWYYPSPLDLNLLNKGAEEIMGFDDFKSFTKLHSDVNNHYCKVHSASWELNDEKLVFTIRANRFLRNMVRAIVGTLIDIGRGKLTIDDLKRIIEGRDRSLAGFSVPAHGLVLYDIEYPDLHSYR